MKKNPAQKIEQSTHRELSFAHLAFATGGGFRPRPYPNPDERSLPKGEGINE